MQPSSSPVAAAAAVAAVASTSTFKNWRKNNPEKYEQYKQRKAASMRAKRKSNPGYYEEEKKRKRDKRIAERIRAAEAKRAEAAAKNEAATTIHLFATPTVADHQQLQPTTLTAAVPLINRKVERAKELRKKIDDDLDQPLVMVVKKDWIDEMKKEGSCCIYLHPSNESVVEGEVTQRPLLIVQLLNDLDEKEIKFRYIIVSDGQTTPRT
jgi:hypothetical protein